MNHMSLSYGFRASLEIAARYGSLILLGLSPVLPALSGFVAYCTSLRARAQPKVPRFEEI